MKKANNLNRVYFTVKSHPKIEIKGLKTILSDVDELEIKNLICDLLRDKKVKMFTERIKNGIRYKGQFFTANVKTEQTALF